MKMEKIPFDLERARRGDDVVDGLGCTVRIICFDFKERGYPLVGETLENEEDEEDYHMYSHNTYTNEGAYLIDKQSNLDLFMKYPEK